MSGFSLTLSASSGPEREALIADLWEAGTTGITEDELWLRAFFDGTVDSAALLQRFADYHPVIEAEDDRDWVRHAQSLWQPFAVGEQFWLAPEWDEEPTPGDRIRLAIRPGLACGSGSHPATRLCLEALEQEAGEGSRVLDVGTGSGILAEAAQRLGARLVIGCDIDHDATVVAHRNVPDVPFFTGSLRSVADSAFDVVVANLNAATLAVLAADLFRVCAGVVIVSGFRDFEVQELRMPVAASRVKELDGWTCVEYRNS